MRRLLVLAYGAFAYVTFVSVFAVLVDFLAGAGFVRAIDDGPTAPSPVAVAIDVALVALFGVSHSVLARPAVKERCRRVLPQAIERSTFVLVANVVLALTLWQWRTIPASVWSIQAPAIRIAAWGLSAGGVALVVVSTFLTDHFDLFGVRQAWLYARGRPYAPVPFRIRGLYRWVRHPMMVGIVVWFWATPTMSVGHLVFAAGMSVYVAVGVAFEERGLTRAFGESYERYRRQVGAFLPRWPSDGI